MIPTAILIPLLVATIPTLFVVFLGHLADAPADEILATAAVFYLAVFGALQVLSFFIVGAAAVLS